MAEMMLFSGSSNPQLAASIAENLDCPLGKAVVGKFSDGETMIEILENVRGKHIFIMQSLCSPTNDNLMELLLMADAFRRSSASKVTAFVPYYGYARQDRRVRSARVPISAKVIADMMAVVGITRVITVDLHADQIQGFFTIPVDNVYATPIILDDLQKRATANTLIVSPDIGGVMRARAIAKRLDDSDLAIIDKRRPKPNTTQVMHIIGDVAGRDCVIIDDIVDTAGTLCQAALALKEHGANSVRAYITHPVFSGHAIDNIKKSALDEVVVTDTIPLKENASQCEKIKTLTLSSILAEAIMRIMQQKSVSSMFSE
ncbi:MAG: ribose-phosphate pyrophosphokinase [Pseudomonadota bacterium]